MLIKVLNNLQLTFNFYLPTIVGDLFTNNIITTLYSTILKHTKITTPVSSFNKNNVNTLSENTNTLLNNETFTYTLGESIDESRALRASNPVFKYDYKLGNYLTKETMAGFPNLLLSQVHAVGGGRKAA